MHKSILISFLLLTTTGISLGVPASFTLAQESIPIETNARCEDPQSWWKIFCRKRRKGGGRGHCSIWPNQHNPDLFVTWADRPLFIWKGRVKQVALRRAGAETSFWLHTIEGAEQFVRYDGSALESGQEYDYLMTYEVIDRDGNTTVETAEIPFEVLGSKIRSRIESDLTNLENTNPTTSEDKSALQRANYLSQFTYVIQEDPQNVQKGLWSDVFQEAFSVQRPSAELTQFKQELVRESCPPN